jgi:hypothetical protein
MLNFRTLKNYENTELSLNRLWHNEIAHVRRIGTVVAKEVCIMPISMFPKGVLWIFC